MDKSGDYKKPICVEVERNATIANLRSTIARNIGIPEEQQRLVWIHSGGGSKFDVKSRATNLIEDTAELQKHIGIGHGDKIHLEDRRNGEDSVLDHIVREVCTRVWATQLT